MLPAIDSGDDAVWFGGPDEGLWIVVGLGEEAVDGEMQIVAGAKDTAFQPPAGELGARYRPLRPVTIRDDSLKLTAIVGRDSDGDSWSHNQTLNRFSGLGIL